MKLNLLRSKQLLAGLSFAVAPIAAMATPTADEFSTFANTVTGWATGPLGVGLATSMLLIGAGVGVAKNSPMPALSGIAGAAFLHWGPNIITTMMGAVL
jgi:conjugal transfer pilus assembly protein TraA